MFPVSPPPRVRVCLAVVAIVPCALRDNAPLVPAETEAVGVPEPVILITANLAEAVVEPPSKRSFVIWSGASAPFILCQKLRVLELAQDGAPVPPDCRICPEVPAASISSESLSE